MQREAAVLWQQTNDWEGALPVETDAETTDRRFRLLSVKIIPYSQYPGDIASLRGALLQEAQSLYGRRLTNWSIGGTTIRDDIAQPIAARPFADREFIEIKLAACDRYPQRLLFQLAHEVVHLLSPSHTKPTLSLEEGLAVSFSRLVVARNCPGYDVFAGGRTEYFSAAADYMAAQALRHDFVKAARLEVPDIGDFTPELLTRVAPEITPELAAALCAPFDYSGTAEPIGEQR